MRRSWSGLSVAALQVLVLVLVLGTATAQARHHSRRAGEGGADIAGAFDYYLLSLSVAPSFCALSPLNRARQECRDLTDAAYRQTPLTVHGLWPNRAFVSVNRQPQHCPGPALAALPASTQAQLQRFMPGGLGLAQHEWDRHGVCSGLSPDAYFAALVQLAQAANGTIGAAMTGGGMLGRTVRIDDLLAAVAVRDPALAASLVVSCRFARGSAAGDRALIEEIRVVLSKDLAPMPVDRVGLRHNSGCPQGSGFLPGSNN